MPHVRKLGSQAEDRAAHYLLNLGYVIVGRRIRVGAKELDIVAIDGDTLVIVEVKFSRVAAIPAGTNMSSTKVQRIEEAGLLFARNQDWGERPVRFDLITIDQDRLTHHMAAFAGP